MYLRKIKSSAHIVLTNRPPEDLAVGLSVIGFVVGRINGRRFVGLSVNGLAVFFVGLWWKIWNVKG